MRRGGISRLECTMEGYYVAAVSVWWIASIIASIASKNVMEEFNVTSGSIGSWTPALEDLRWIELSFLQHLLGGMVSVFRLKVVLRKSIWTEGLSKRTICIVALTNLAGNLGTNAALAAVSSCMTHVIRACEPTVTIVLPVCVYKKWEMLPAKNIMSVSLIVIGAGALVMSDFTFNVWGLIAAIGSTVSFAVCNAFLQLIMSNDLLQIYAVVSVLGTLFLLPVMVVKVAITKVLFTTRIMDSLTSAVFYFVYNTASISVLQGIGPLSYAFLDHFKTIVVIVANIEYFRTPAFTWVVCLSLLVLFVGHFLHSIPSTSKHVRLLLFCLLSISTVAFVFITVLFSKTESFSCTLKNESVVSTPLCDSLRISTSWVFEEPIPHNVIHNIEVLAKQNPSVTLTVYCGTSRCVHSVRKLDVKNIKVEFLKVGDIVKNMPLEEWLARHPINKVLAGEKFENHLNEAVKVGLLWTHGGMYFDPTMAVIGQFNLRKHQEKYLLREWVSKQTNSSENNASRILDIAMFPTKHPFIEKLAEAFAKQYPKKASEDNSFNFNFCKLAWNMYNSLPESQRIGQIVLPLERIFSTGNSPDRAHFGTLSYDSRVAMASGANLGNEIQRFAGIQYLPYVDFFLEHDNLKKSAGKENITVFFNALWGSPDTSWPPPSNVQPTMISVQFGQGMSQKWENSIDYLKEHSPIGCHDYPTLDLMQKHGIMAYFSGCLTLTVSNPNLATDRTKVYLVDVSDKYVKLLPRKVKDNALVIHHNLEGTGKNDRLSRFTAAYNLMEMYGSAKLVITERIDTALPCVAMGTPVIFINSPSMPREKGTKVTSPHTTGLTQMFHTLDLYNMTTKMAEDWITKFSWNTVPPNPNAKVAMRLRATAWNVIRQNQAMYDAARKFGLLPLSQATPVEVKHLVFHLIFTTSRKQTINLFANGGSLSGSLNWKHWRCIESIFHHHPFAKLIMHSNTLLQSEFDVLTEAGYSVEVRGYNLEAMLKDSPASAFTTKLKAARKGYFWYSHETDLLRGLILYQQGGVYMDTDMIVVRPVDSLIMNVLAWEDSQESLVNGAFMKFEKGNPYLELYLREFGTNYDSSSWAGNGPSLLTRLWRQWKGDPNAVHVLQHNAFYMFHYSAITRECFNKISEETLASRMKTLREEAYVVHLNAMITGKQGIEKLKNGTICSYLLNSFCVLCNIIY